MFFSVDIEHYQYNDQCYSRETKRKLNNKQIKRKNNIKKKPKEINYKNKQIHTKEKQLKINKEYKKK